MERHRWLNEGWTFATVDEDGATGKFAAARVPGSVYSGLVQASEIADPRYADNARSVGDVSRRDWLYRLPFSLTEEERNSGADRVELVFEGLDTFAEIRLNGQILGESENMFLPWRAEVGPILREDNVLEVLFRSSERMADERAGRMGLEPGRPASRAAAVRKMALSWGRGNLPALPGCGIWRPCGLTWAWKARIHDVWTRVAALSADRAELAVVIEVESFAPCLMATVGRLCLDEKEIGREERVADLQGGRTVLELRLEIPSPRLWQPIGRGQATLYDLEISLLDTEGPGARARRKVGLRTVQLRTVEALPAGRQGEESPPVRRLFVNGDPLFVQGANWLPADLYPARCDDPRALHALERLAAANANTVRVWGGGLYESEAFYDACDRLGLLVWQDFPLPGGPIDTSAESLENLAAEVRWQIRRLRSHPSLALWRGAAGPAQSPDAPPSDDAVFRGLIPQALSELDPDRPYLAGPSEPGWEETRLRPGWETAAELARRRPRFVSEAGLLALPSVKTVKRHLPPDERQMNSPLLAGLTEGGADGGAPRMARHVAHYFALPERFEDWAYASQLAQAEHCRELVEGLRAAHGRTHGILLWAWMDPFFGVTRQAIDCHGRPKALAYVAARFFAPVLPVFRARENDEGRPAADEIELLVVNSRPFALHGEAILEHWSLDGRLKGSKTFEVEIAADSAGRAAVFHPSRFRPNVRSDLLAARVVENGEVAGESIWLFTRPKFLQHPRIDVTIEVEAETHNLFAVRLQTPHVALGVALETVSLEEVEFDDNYFYLLPERPKTVLARTAEPVDAEAFRRDLEVRSLHDRSAAEIQGKGAQA